MKPQNSPKVSVRSYLLQKVLNVDSLIGINVFKNENSLYNLEIVNTCEEMLFPEIWEKYFPEKYKNLKNHHASKKKDWSLFRLRIKPKEVYENLSGLKKKKIKKMLDEYKNHLQKRG